MRRLDERELGFKSTEWLVEEERKRSVRNKSVYFKTSELEPILDAIYTRDFSLLQEVENLENVKKVGWGDPDDLEILGYLYDRYVETGEEKFVEISTGGAVFPLSRSWLIYWYLEK